MFRIFFFSSVVLLQIQLNFFRKGLKSLEAIEPHVRLVTEQQHIEYQFSGLEDNEGEYVEDDGDNGNDANEDGELSFDYRPNKQGLDVPMEVRIYGGGGKKN